MSSPDLSVVCKNCGSEVSPYVTECPYCGQRLRKRAPKLEREGDEIKVHETRREKRRREKLERKMEQRAKREERAEARAEASGLGISFGGDEIDGKPIATIGYLLIAAILLVVQRAVPLSIVEAGAIFGGVGSEAWRYITAPFVYDDVGALAITGGAIAVFGKGVETRVGSVPTAILIIACGTTSMLVADGVTSVIDDFALIAGGNGIALGLLGCWLMMRRAEAENRYADPLDVLGVGVAAAVLLLLPLVESSADPFAGVAGGMLGILLGRLAVSRKASAS